MMRSQFEEEDGAYNHKTIFQSMSELFKVFSEETSFLKFPTGVDSRFVIAVDSPLTMHYILIQSFSKTKSIGMSAALFLMHYNALFFRMIISKTEFI